MTIDNECEFIGTVTKCIYRSETFSVYSMSVDTNKFKDIKKGRYNNVSIIGDLPELSIGVKYNVAAMPEKNKYGISYRVSYVQRDLPETKDGVLAFLQETLTPRQATVLYDVYPDIITRVKDNNLDDIDLGKLDGIGEYRFNVIKTKIIENFGLASIIMEFKGVFTKSMATKIKNRYSSVATFKKDFKEDPYRTLTSFSGVGFKKADALILQMQDENAFDFGYDVRTSEYRCLACVRYILEENETACNTKMGMADARSKCIKLASECVDNFEEVILDDTIHYDKSEMTIGFEKTYRSEKHIADEVYMRSKFNPIPWKYDIENYRDIDGIMLSDEQVSFLEMVCNKNFALLTAPAGCVDCDTEFFDGHGWKRISEYKDGDKVLQYNEDGTANLVTPLRYIKQPTEYLWHFKTKYGLDQCLSDNHTCYYLTRDDVMHEKKFKEIRETHDQNGFTGRFMTTFDYSGDGIDLSDDEIRLMVATFADGSFYYRDNCSEEVYTQSRFHLKKDRKKQRLVDIASRANVECVRSDSAAEGYDDYYIKVPFRAKHFPKEWYNCNKHQLQVIADEVMFWDGEYKKNNRYSTTCKGDADFIQFVYSALGYRATILINDRVGQKHLTGGKEYTRKSVEYTVSYTSRTLVGMCSDKRENHKKTEILPYKTIDGYEYCFTVPSHMLVLRRGDRIFITGNCGKTFATKALINMLEDNNKTYLCMSPTGKAAKRLSEYTGRPAYTIHKALNMQPEEPQDEEEQDGKNPYSLEVDVVIIDEVGMVDVNLFSWLLHNVGFNVKIVLIGDMYQLNSIGCGALLRDLYQSGIAPKVEFTQVYRMGEGGVLTACTHIRQQHKFINKNEMTYVGSDKSYTFVPANKNDMNGKLVSLYKKLLSKVEPKDITVISSYNKGENGCDKLNKLLQPIANPNASSNSDSYMGIGKDDKEVRYYVGDSVIQIKNSYDNFGNLLVANGERGEIVYASYDMVQISFDSINITYGRGEINENIKHAFALSCHRMQGSQNKIIIFCCPSSHVFFLTNNIIYTGVSRAEKAVFHLSDARTLNIAMNKSDVENRKTYLGDMLKEVSIV